MQNELSALRNVAPDPSVDEVLNELLIQFDALRSERFQRAQHMVVPMRDQLQADYVYFGTCTKTSAGQPR